MKRNISIIFMILIIFSSNVFAAPDIVDSGAPEAALTDSEMSMYEAFPKIRVLLKGNRYPYSYYEDGMYKGIYPDYLKNISELSGIEFTFVTYESDEQLEQFFTFGKADALGCTYGSRTGLYKTTEPFTVVEYNLVGMPEKDINEKYSHRVAINDTDIMLKHYIEENYPDWTLVSYNSVRDALKAVNKGKADMTFVTSLDLQLNYSLLPYKHIEVLDNFSLFVPVSMAISTVSCPEEMITLLNKFITCEPIRNNDAIRREYVLNHIYMPNIAEFFFIHSEIVIFATVCVIILVVLLILRWKHMRKKLATDLLTGIWNRDKFINEVKKKVKGNRSTEYLLAVIDVERFKIINDRFGVEVGNQTLRRLAKNIASIFKGSGIYGRNVNDKFVVFLQDTPDHRKLLVQASEMDIRINNATYYQLPIKVGVCPISYSKMGDAGVTAFIDRAKLVNDKIKGHHDKKIAYFTKKMDERLEKENELETIMRKSLKNDEFVVYYQPKYDLTNNKIIGAEALVRWQHPTKGLISPGDFIPLFEKNGFIVELDFYVYEAVMKMLRNRLDSGKSIVTVSMNVSRCHLNSLTFTARLEELADKYKIPKTAIEMEITESVFSDEDTAAVALMEDLKKHGFTLSMDDFGSGYSSLNLLRELPIDTLKIDKGFLDRIDDSSRSKVIVEEIIQMATKIDIRTICEGVETEQQRDFLKQAGCNMAQGFFYARPMPQGDFEALLDKENQY